MSADELTTIGIVDDHQVFAEAVAMVIGREPSLQVVGIAGTCAKALELVERYYPEVLLLDVTLPDGDGLTLVPELRALCSRTQILALTAFSDEKQLMRAINTGVSGFISKDCSLAHVLTAIRQAVAGEIVLPAGLLVGLLSSLRQDERPIAGKRIEPLTAREREILTCLSYGMSSNSIARDLNISLLTVRTHIRNVRSKLGVHSRLEAVTYALRQKLIEPPL